MLKILCSVILFLFSAKGFAQSPSAFSVYFQAQFNHTIKDITKRNNPNGVGVGALAFIEGVKYVKATAELTADAYIGGTKDLLLNPDGSTPNPPIALGGMVNLFVGPSIHPAKFIYLIAAAGPGLVGGRVLLGVKPSVGFFFGPNQKWTAKASYIDFKKRNKAYEEDFTSWSVSVGIKL